jgi:acetone carboxylase gamma subunit
LVEWSEKVYYVSINPKTLEMDHKKTEELRAQKRKERLSVGKAGKEYIKELISKRKSRQLPHPALEFLDELMAFSPAFAKQIEEENKLVEKELKPLGKVEVSKTLLKLTPYVNIAEDKKGKKIAVCSKCGFGYCESDDNFKHYCLIHDRDPEEIYPKRLSGNKDWYTLREFYCPGCGVQVEVEATPHGNTILKCYDVKV